MSTLVHLVYIHGFQGNDTTFQSFPKHLQEYLEIHIPQHHDIKIQSSLYPTYKSVKPISHATRNFLEWLSTQPPGPVILVGHSMGGLLAADAATDPSNNRTPKRIVGVIAFDTPFLGMHPHVVVSGIASLLPDKQKDNGKVSKGKTEERMNQHPDINVVDQKVTDDWEAFGRQMNVHTRNAPYPSNTNLNAASPIRESSHAGLLHRSRSPSSSPSFIDRTINFLSTTSTNSGDPLIKWLKKHSDGPFSAGKRWVIDRFQFGACMFDPTDLKDRYTKLVEWGIVGEGMWVNYWTKTMPRPGNKYEEKELEPPQNSTLHSKSPSPHTSDLPTSSASSLSSIHSPSLSLPDKESIQQSKHNSKSKHKPLKSYHFVVLPNGLGSMLGGMEKWEEVHMTGVDDEVTAHTGLFIPIQNLEYESLVEKVGKRVEAWCDRLMQQVHPTED